MINRCEKCGAVHASRSKLCLRCEVRKDFADFMIERLDRKATRPTVDRSIFNLEWE